MPKIGKPSDELAKFRAIEVERQAAIAELEEFMNPAAWHRTKAGNLSREWEGMTVTVFLNRREYGWVIKDEEDEKQFSKTRYEAEEDAMYGLAEALCVGL